jgi:hypothetical protein
MSPDTDSGRRDHSARTRVLPAHYTPSSLRGDYAIGTGDAVNRYACAAARLFLRRLALRSGALFGSILSPESGCAAVAGTHPRFKIQERFEPAVPREPRAFPKDARKWRLF